MNTAIAIAKHLKVNHWQITRVEKWPTVFFAVVKGLGARFVSKKVAKVNITKSPESLAGLLLDAGFQKANVWKKHGMTRIYTQSGFIDLTGDPKIMGGHSKEEKQSIKECLHKWDSGESPNLKQNLVAEDADDPIVYSSRWSFVGSGQVRVVRHKSGMERVETKGNVLQSDLDDFLG